MPQTPTGVTVTLASATEHTSPGPVTLRCPHAKVVVTRGWPLHPLAETPPCSLPGRSQPPFPPVTPPMPRSGPAVFPGMFVMSEFYRLRAAASLQHHSSRCETGPWQGQNTSSLEPGSAPWGCCENCHKFSGFEQQTFFSSWSWRSEVLGQASRVSLTGSAAAVLAGLGPWGTPGVRPSLSQVLMALAPPGRWSLLHPQQASLWPVPVPTSLPPLTLTSLPSSHKGSWVPRGHPDNPGESPSQQP